MKYKIVKEISWGKDLYHVQFKKGFFFRWRYVHTYKHWIASFNTKKQAEQFIEQQQAAYQANKRKASTLTLKAKAGVRGR
jgi:hypothetical protein